MPPVDRSMGLLLSSWGGLPPAVAMVQCWPAKSPPKSWALSESGHDVEVDVRAGELVAEAVAVGVVVRPHVETPGLAGRFARGGHLELRAGHGAAVVDHVHGLAHAQ